MSLLRRRSMMLPKKTDGVDVFWQLPSAVTMTGNERVTINDLTWLDLAVLDTFTIAFSFTNTNTWNWAFGEVFSWNGSGTVNGSVNFVGMYDSNGWRIRDYVQSNNFGMLVGADTYKSVIISTISGSGRVTDAYLVDGSLTLGKIPTLNGGNNTTNDQPLTFGDPWGRVKGTINDFTVYDGELNKSQIESYLGVSIP